MLQLPALANVLRSPKQRVPFPSCRAGPPGADATALLLPSDGSLELLLQPHTGAVGVAINAQLLPLQLSVPAASAISAVVSALFPGDAEEPAQQQPQQLAARPGSPRVPPPSAAAVAAAATVIIEDASAMLRPHDTHGSLDVAAAVPVSATAPTQQQQQQQQQDDLAAALFTFVHSGGHSRPAPLQVQAASAAGEASAAAAAAGLGARLWNAAAGGSGRQELEQPRGAAVQGIRWCYPQPREVALLAVEVRPACSITL